MSITDRPVTQADIDQAYNEWVATNATAVDASKLLPRDNVGLVELWKKEEQALDRYCQLVDLFDCQQER